MELKYLKTLKTIIETGTFIGAARRLNYTQSTVTFQIQQLEQELSVKLFEKIGRKMILTQDGHELIPYIDNILQNVEQLENYGKDTKELCGELKVAMPESLLTYQMQPILKAFREQAPGVKLFLQAQNCYTIRDQIANGGADIGIHYDVGGYGTTMIAEDLICYSLALIANPAIKGKNTDFMTKNQRKEICLLTNDTESIYHKVFDGYLQNMNICLSGTMEVGSIEAIKRSVISDLGIAFLPRFVVQKELEEGILQELKTDISNNKITATCVYHKNKWITPAMELFIRLSHELLK
ncbi:MAG: LysR family transcriptional regulator [Paraclostridium sordellii]|uniref:Transcriptional regulator n=1 Tax=Paraclostridium sordellii TaxID=1505 RepID=A0A0C7R287_PARSO|nr:LysR family transcriptional regulator [Paeniclostridium sordellii]QYE99079.1 LysR family transcriptional regulator [Paeniclostridium sordellii]CEQ02960.1 transcriptional regulator [[Clostridium] sordellii] [Paeniclostridium sordellii]